MPKYLVKWELNPLFIPKDPEEMIKGWLMMSEWVRAEMEAGIIKDFGVYADGSGGYGVREQESDQALYASLLKYIPYLIMDAKPVVTLDQNIEAIKKAAAAAAQAK